MRVLTPEQKKEAFDNLKKLNALPPYDNFSNICAHDGYFAKDIERRFLMTIEELSIACGLKEKAAAYYEAKKEAAKLLTYEEEPEKKEKCPHCGDPVASVFDHVDIDCI